MEGDSKSKRQAQKRGVKKAALSEALTEETKTAVPLSALPTSPQTTAKPVKPKKTVERKKEIEPAPVEELVPEISTDDTDAVTAVEPVVPAKTTLAPARPATRRKSAGEPTLEEIQLRAYFIGERRKSKGLPGDSTSDWVQAEQELTEELAGFKV